MNKVLKKNTESKIVESAITLFRTRPYNDVTVQDICKEAGVTRNSFYYYFPTKDAIFNSIGVWLRNTARARITGIFGAKSYYQQFWEFYKEYLSLQLELGPEIMNHISTSFTENDGHNYFLFIDSTISSAMIRLLHKAQDSSEIMNLRPAESLIWTSYAVIRGVNIKWVYQWGTCDLLAEAKAGLDDLFQPNSGFELK